MSHLERKNLSKVSWKELIEKPEKTRPHVVILGAGASVQAFPSGDVHGKKLPTMNSLIEIVGLDPLLKKYKIDIGEGNFENLYSKLYIADPSSQIIKEIEQTVQLYFCNLSLPSTPTLYDHLLLSLRPKDMVATFNWDPFLFDAWERNQNRAPLPEIVHLHGNVRIGYCEIHKIQGYQKMNCPECQRPLKPSPLLYPITSKDYISNVFIKQEWEQIKKALKSAFTLSIFGYGAPKSDVEAIRLMKEAWLSRNGRTFESIEIIDIKDKKILEDQWKPFSPSYHFIHNSDFYSSRIPLYSRRSCEALAISTIHAKFVGQADFPKEADFNQLTQWLQPLVTEEARKI